MHVPVGTACVQLQWVWGGTDRFSCFPQFDMSDILFNELEPFRMLPPIPELSMELSAPPLIEAVQQAPVPGAVIPQEGMQEPNCTAAARSLCLPNSGKEGNFPFFPCWVRAQDCPRSGVSLATETPEYKWGIHMQRRRRRGG